LNCFNIPLLHVRKGRVIGASDRLYFALGGYDLKPMILSIYFDCFENWTIRYIFGMIKVV
jgi:hypothetical protein